MPTDWPIILVDMDGPLAAFDRQFLRRVRENGWAMDIENEWEQRHRFATDHIISAKERKLARAMVGSAGWFADLPVVDGALDGLLLLEEQADVWIVTKPLEVNPTCRDDKAAWMAKHFGERWLDKLIISPNKSMVRGHILLDDAPHIDWMEHASWHSVIFPMPWNDDGSKWAGLPRWSWEDDTEELMVLARYAGGKR